jgi:hypothetical protein
MLGIEICIRGQSPSVIASPKRSKVCGGRMKSADDAWRTSKTLCGGVSQRLDVLSLPALTDHQSITLETPVTSYVRNRLSSVIPKVRDSNSN